MSLKIIKIIIIKQKPKHYIIKNTGNKNPYMDYTHKELETLILI